MLLAVDTSTGLSSLALYNGVQVLAELTWYTRHHHTVELAPLVAQLLQRAALAPSDLKVLAAATGPGSFSGLRIGLAFIKGLALAWRLPILGIPTLDALAASQTLPSPPLPLAAVLAAGRGRLAVGWYQVQADAWLAQGKPQLLDLPTLAHLIQTPTLVCGELNEPERQLLARKRKNVILASPAHSLRRAGFLAELAWRRFQAGQLDDPASLAPHYLHLGEPIPG